MGTSPPAFSFWEERGVSSQANKSHFVHRVLRDARGFSWRFLRPVGSEATAGVVNITFLYLQHRAGLLSALTLINFQNCGSRNQRQQEVERGYLCRALWGGGGLLDTRWRWPSSPGTSVTNSAHVVTSPAKHTGPQRRWKVLGRPRVDIERRGIFRVLGLDRPGNNPSSVITVTEAARGSWARGWAPAPGREPTSVGAVCVHLWSR